MSSRVFSRIQRTLGHGPLHGLRLYCVVPVTLAILIATFVSLSPSSDATRPQFSGALQMPTTRATIGRFIRRVPVSGEVRSYRPDIVFNSCRWWDREIIELVPEGSWVEEGDIVCVLDSRELKERLFKQELDLIRANAAIAKADARETLQDALNQRRLETSHREMNIAQDRFQAYYEGEADLERKQIDAQVLQSEALLLQAEESLDHTSAMAAMGYANTSQLKRETTRTERLHRDTERLHGEMNLFQEFRYPRQLVNLERQADNRRLDFQLTQLDTGYASAFTAAGTLEAHQSRASVNVFHEYLQRAIAACTMRAPRAGQIVYAHQPEIGRYIEVGQKVYHTQDIIRIVDRSTLVVAGAVSDRQVYDLKEGQPVQIRVASQSDDVVHGTLNWISPIPGPMNWFEPERLFHKVQIILDDDRERLDRLALGTTATGEIIVEVREGVLQVPITAVCEFEHGHEVLVKHHRHFSRQTITCGHSNDAMIEILDGLTEGDEVVDAGRYKLLDIMRQLPPPDDSSATRE